MPKDLPPWFLQLVAFLLGGYFLWSIQRILKDLKEGIRDLKDTIRLLFHKNDNHENRLSRLEGRCGAMHGQLQPQKEQPSGWPKGKP